MLGPTVRARLEERAGYLLEWWAWLDPDGRPAAVVFGPRGLCRAASVISNGRRVYLVERLRLDPATPARRTFDRTAPTDRPRTVARLLRRTPSTDGPTPPPAHPPPLDLHDEDRRILGNFPTDVRDFLQRPFLPDDRAVTADWYHEETVELTQRRLIVLFCLTADHNVTLASATRTGSRARSAGHARWTIQCYHARIRRPRATPPPG
ncbi:hypothetical protein [Embleya sp. AB8]|uniref:hypothetical protein n=1 Tax=Embleya sp. AB8 TaxID=3156304 RepID=UPI003C7716AC